jgi:2-hydroxy-3-keto-5-methylthiopentenyl-1-phosphate phosphatase
MGVSFGVSEKRLAFYCDFDGTIAEQDMIGAIVKEFAPPEAMDIVAAVNARHLSIREGVEAMFRLIPSRQLPQLKEFARRRTVIRAGFGDFVRLCQQRNWRLAVVSGGFDFFVQPALAPYQDTVQVFCNTLDDSGAHLEVRWRQTCDAACDGGCGLCKPSVIRSTIQPGEQIVVIGDGVTDVKAARMADFVFARDKLLGECTRIGLHHAAFATFYDIVHHPYLQVQEGE